MSVKGKRYWTAVSREEHSPDRLISWTGRRDNPSQLWTQESTETRGEFYNRVEGELVNNG